MNRIALLAGALLIMGASCSPKIAPGDGATVNSPSMSGASRTATSTSATTTGQATSTNQATEIKATGANRVNTGSFE